MMFIRLVNVYIHKYFVFSRMFLRNVSPMGQLHYGNMTNSPTADSPQGVSL